MKRGFARLLGIVVGGFVLQGAAIAGDPAVTGPDEDGIAGILVWSQATILDESGSNEVQPHFGFICSPGQSSGLQAVIYWRRFISSFNTDIAFKVDDGKRMWLKFGVDSSNKTTSAKSQGDSDALIDYLAGGEVLKVSVTPYSESEVSVTFNLGPLLQGLAELRSQCGLD